MGRPTLVSSMAETAPRKAKFAYENHRPTAITIVLGSARPANGLVMPLALTEETAMKKFEFDGEMESTVTALSTARADEAEIVKALGDTEGADRIVHALRVLGDADKGATVKALTAAGFEFPKAEKVEPVKVDPIAAALASEDPNARKAIEILQARADALTAENAENKAASEKAVALAVEMKADADLKDITAMCLTKLGNVPGADTGDTRDKLPGTLQRVKAACVAAGCEADYTKIVGRFENASAQLSKNPKLGTIGTDATNDATSDEGEFEKHVSAHMASAKVDRAHAVLACTRDPKIRHLANKEAR